VGAMKRTIFVRTFLSYVFISITVSLLIFFFTTSIFERQYSKTIRQDQARLAVSLGRDILALVEHGQRSELDDFIKQTKKQIGTRITVIAPDGSVLADSEKDPRTMENHGDRPEVYQALRGGEGEYARFSFTLQQQMHYYAFPLSRGNKTVAVVRLSVLAKEFTQALGQIRRKLILVILPLLLVSFLLAYVFSRNLTTPIRQLIRASERIGGGDLDVRVHSSRKDEIKTLVDSFNSMTSRQKSLLENLRRNQQEMQTVISSISDGLVILDLEGKILLHNEGFRRMAGKEDLKGKYYWEILRDSESNAILKKAMAQKAAASGEVEIRERAFFNRFDYLQPAEMIVVTFHDISELKKLEKIKKDFVVNLSHELRTPLTAIKGFLETMEENETPGNRAYLEIIQRHTNRLIDIVSDLLTLSELEEKSLKPEVTRIDLKVVARNVTPIFEKKIGEKGLTLDVEIRDDLPPFFGDPFKLEQMLINLLDNAVRYTEKGGIRLSIDFREGQFLIRVRDTGIGISREHLPRIFERFYVADKSRSRAAGGTGLGLSIVKHIVLLHNGDIRVNSSPGQGTEFHITLPAVNPPS
jgi:two-component system, OmpR family, phosphate regulon sensor histidine kinase PhoR